MRRFGRGMFRRGWFRPRMFHRGRFHPRGACWRGSLSEPGMTLADVPAGGHACVCGFMPGLSPERRAHLQAYGLVPGHWVRILQHSPVTIVQIEHLELAMEQGLARQVQVEAEE